MTDKQKIERLETLGWDMYHAAQNLTTDASSLHKAMNKWWQFVNHELQEEETVSESLEEAAREAATANRQLYNRAILAILSDYIEKYPDIRFGQMLCSLDINPHFDEESRKTYCNLNETINKQKS